MFALEILNDDLFDKKNSTWWYTDRGGLWGDCPYLHLGERTWDDAQRAVIERFYIVNLETGEMQSYGLSDQAYSVAQMTDMLRAAGFSQVQTYPAWEWPGDEGRGGMGGVCGDEVRMTSDEDREPRALFVVGLSLSIVNPLAGPPTRSAGRSRPGIRCGAPGRWAVAACGQRLAA